MNDEHYSKEENTKTAAVVTAVFFGVGFTLTLAVMWVILSRL